jgi:hypothetical protein
MNDEHFFDYSGETSSQRCERLCRKEGEALADWSKRIDDDMEKHREWCKKTGFVSRRHDVR